MGFANSVTEKPCCFCKERYWTEECFVVKNWTLDECCKKSKNERRCYRGLKAGHTANRCRTIVKCCKCSSMSYVAIMCSRQSSMECNKPQVENEEKNKSMLDTNPEPISNLSLSNQTCIGDIAFLTTTVDIIGPNSNSKRVRNFIDTGTQYSHVTETLAREMGYKAMGKARLTHVLFGGETRLLEYQTYKI